MEAMSVSKVKAPTSVNAPTPVKKQPGVVYAGGNPNFDMRTGTFINPGPSRPKQSFTPSPIAAPINRADSPVRVARPMPVLKKNG